MFFLTELLRLISGKIVRNIRDVFTKESVVFENHDIVVGINYYIKNSFVLIKGSLIYYYNTVFILINPFIDHLKINRLDRLKVYEVSYLYNT